MVSESATKTLSKLAVQDHNCSKLDTSQGRRALYHYVQISLISPTVSKKINKSTQVTIQVQFEVLKQFKCLNVPMA